MYFLAKIKFEYPEYIFFKKYSPIFALPILSSNRQNNNKSLVFLKKIGEYCKNY